MDDHNQSSGWDKISTVANIVVAITAIIALVYTVRSVEYLFTTTPLYEGTRPQLSFHTSTSNSVEKDKDGLMAASPILWIHNTSKFAAKDVYVVIKPLGKSGWTVDCEYPIEELKDVGDNRRIIVVKTLPALSLAKIECTEKVAAFPEVAFVPSTLHLEPSDLEKRAGKCFDYTPHIERVYTEFGDVPQLFRLNVSHIEFVPEDYRSKEGQERLKGLLAKLPPDNRKEWEQFLSRGHK